MYKMTSAEAARIAFYVGYHTALGHIVHVATGTANDTKRIMLHIFDEKGEFAEPIVIFSLPLDTTPKIGWQYMAAIYDMIQQIRDQFPTKHVV